ncbi:MAG TPA: hypothetical protein VFQ61_18575 [Polyangiaceae bacterium]|nr:hypothetical protein [Polyangiaceae bacterium]
MFGSLGCARDAGRLASGFTCCSQLLTKLFALLLAAGALGFASESLSFTSLQLFFPNLLLFVASLLSGLSGLFGSFTSFASLLCSLFSSLRCSGRTLASTTCVAGVDGALCAPFDGINRQCDRSLDFCRYRPLGDAREVGDDTIDGTSEIAAVRHVLAPLSHTLLCVVKTNTEFWSNTLSFA